MDAPVAERLAYLHAKMETCTLCSLHKTRKCLVFGEGQSGAKIVLVGEAPGKTEDLTGRPFAGQSGTLLNSLLEQAGLSRDQVFVTNAIHCRPPENRDPTPEEIQACERYLHAQLYLLQPKVVVTLGRFAGNLLCGNQLPLSMGALLGKVKSYNNPKTQVSLMVVPTYHPAYLLRQQDEALNAAVVEHLRLAVSLTLDTSL